MGESDLEAGSPLACQERSLRLRGDGCVMTHEKKLSGGHSSATSPREFEGQLAPSGDWRLLPKWNKEGVRIAFT